MLWNTHRCNLPYVKVQEAKESKFSESAEDRDEADDDEDVQSSCICNLMMIMMMIMKQYYLAVQILNAVAIMRITCGLVLPPNPIVTTANVLVAPSPVLAAVS